MHAPENKMATTLDAAQAFDEFMHLFEAFKETNDRRLAEIEARTADVLTEEKLARIDRALDDQKRAMDDLAVKARRPMLAGERETRGGPRAAEHKAAFYAYVRGGEAGGLRALEAKALSAGSDPDGGYLVPEEIEREIGTRLAALSPIRELASVRQVSSLVYKKPFAATGPEVGWVGETDPRPQTASPTLAELEFPAMELYAMPAATQTLLDDAAVDIDQWLAGEIEGAFAEQETQAFVNGNGLKKPRGFLNAARVVESAWTWGKLGTSPSGGSGAFAATDPANALVDLVYALKSGYRQNATFVMNRRTQAAVRKLKDSDGGYLWQAPAQPGGRAGLMTFPVVEIEAMPDIAANSASIAFGDFRRGYLVVDRLGVRVLRDPYSAKPYVLFYTTKRVGGGVQDFDAIKLMTFAAS